MEYVFMNSKILGFFIALYFSSFAIFSMEDNLDKKRELLQSIELEENIKTKIFDDNLHVDYNTFCILFYCYIGDMKKIAGSSMQDELKTTYNELFDMCGKTPIHYAVLGEHQNLEIINLILQAGPYLLNQRDINDDLPLELAIKNEKWDIVKHLLSLDLIDYGRTMYLAIEKDNIEIITILIEKGISINCRDRDNRIPLHYAATTNKYEVAVYLINNGADKTNRDNYGLLPLNLLQSEATDDFKELLKFVKVKKVKEVKKEKCNIQ